MKRITCIVAVFMLTATMIPSIAFASGATGQTEVSEGMLSCVSEAETADGTVSESVVEDDGDSLEPGKFYTCEKIRYELSDGEITVFSGVDDASGVVEIPEQIKGYPVTAIDSIAFRYQENITEVVLPETIKSIGADAFLGCTGLEKINLPEGITVIEDGVFTGCTALKSITLPTTLKSIGNSSFRACKSLTEIDVRGGVTSIGVGAFAVCEELVSVKLPATLKRIGWNAFEECRKLESINIPYGITVIEQDTFKECNSLKTIDIPDSVDTIEKGAFYNCDAMTDAVIGAGTLEYQAFVSCDNLEKVVFTDNVNTLKRRAFYDCNKISKVSFSEGLETLADNCILSSVLETVDLPRSLQSIDKESFSYATLLGCYRGSYAHTAAVENDRAYYIIDADTAENTVAGDLDGNLTWKLDKVSRELTVTCDGEMRDFKETTAPWYTYRNYIKKIKLAGNCTGIGDYAFYGLLEAGPFEIPETVTSLGRYAFGGCSKMTEIRIPDSVTEIGSYAFSCGITSVDIPSGVTELKEGVFSDSDLTSVTIPGNVKTIGNKAFGDCWKLESVVICSGVETIGTSAFYDCRTLNVAELPDSVKTIENYAFKSCDELERIELPETLELLGESAFEHCESLKYIEIPGSLKSIATAAFYGCDSLAEAVLGEGIECIGNRAFGSCKEMVKADIPKSVKTIERAAFQGCKKLAEIDLSGNVQEVGDSAFQGCASLITAVIPDSMTKVPSRMFGDCSALKEVVIPDTVTEIEGSAFSGCTSLTQIDLPDALTVIREFAFDDCDSLTEITVPEGVVLIERSAFDGSDNLRTVKLPATLETLQYDAFSGCVSLESVNIPERITVIDSDLFDDCKSLKTVKLHDGITRIESYAFSGSGITEIEIPGSVRNIGYRAFCDCKNLISVKMNDGILTMEGKVFENCSGLETVIFGEGLETIGYDAFYLCSKLGAVTIPSTVTAIGSSAFYGCESLKEITFKGFVEDMRADAFEAYNPIVADVYYYENIGWDNHIEKIIFNAPQLTWIPVEHTHEFDSGKVTQEATCTAEGVFTYTCEDCKYKYNEAIELTDHVIERTPAVLPTCTEDGYTAGEKCSTCGEFFAGVETVPAAGHKFGDWVLTKITTCVSHGEQIRVCEVCGEKDTENLPMIDHVRYSIPGFDATCTEEGKTRREECALCGTVLQYDEVIPKLPHKHGRWIIETEATCTERGLKYRLCECGNKITEMIPATGHTEVVIPEKPADCDYGGHSEGVKCSICNVWLVAPVIGDTPVHEYSSEYKVCQPATMQKEGYKAKTCVKCGAVGEDTVVIPRIRKATVANLIYNGSVRNPVPNIVNYKNTKLKKGKDYTVVYKNANATKVVKPENVGKYTAVITFKGEYKGTVKRTFTINPKATVINKLTKPGRKQIKVTWQKRTAQVTGYEIQYSTTKNFTKKTTKTLKVKNYKTNTKTIKQLKAKKKYWVKVRTYKNVNGKLYYSKWSPVKTIITK